MTYRDRQEQPRIGIWRAVGSLGNYRFKKLLWPEGLPAIVLGVGGAVAIVRTSAVAERIDLMGAITSLAIALMAITMTALAIMVALPAGSYLRALQKDDAESDGMQRFLEPFLIAVGIQIAVILLSLALATVGSSVPRAVEHGAFYVLGFLVVYGLLDVAAIARALVRHGIYRAQDAVREAQGKNAENVRELRNRRIR